MIIPLYLSSQDNFTPLVPPLLLARSIRTTNSFSRHNLSWTTSFYLSLSRRYPCFTIDILTHVSFNQERSNCLIYLVHFIIVHSTYRRILVSVRLLATYITIHFIHLSYNNRSILLARPLFRVTRLAARDNRAVSPLLLLLLRRRGMYTWHDGTRGIDYYWAGTCTMSTRFVQRATIYYPINRGRLIVEAGGIVSRWQIRKRRKRRGESRQGCQGWTIWPRARYVVRSDDLPVRPRRGNYSALERWKLFELEQ